MIATQYNISKNKNEIKPAKHIRCKICNNTCDYLSPRKKNFAYCCNCLPIQYIIWRYKMTKSSIKRIIIVIMMMIRVLYICSGVIVT